MVLLLRERECALIEVAAGKPGRKRDFAHRILERNPREGLSQQCIGVIGARLLQRGWWRDDQNDFTARFAGLRQALCQGNEIAATNFLVQLGELAAQRHLARPQRFRKISESCRDARSGFEQQ